MSIESKTLPIVFIVGTPRSGTHLLASIIKNNSTCQYTGELNSFWKKYTGNSTDFASVKHLNSKKISIIRNDFYKRYVPETQVPFILEKTPSNSMRIDFLKTIFPEAKFIHIIRDGRDVAVSIRKKYYGDNRKITQFDDDKTTVKGNIRLFKNTARKINRAGNLPKYITGNISKILQHLLVSFNLKKHFHWGVRYPGWRKYYKELSHIESSGVQWQVCILNILNNWNDLDTRNRLEIHYEQLIEDTENVLKRVFTFIEGKTAKKSFKHPISYKLSNSYTKLSEDELKNLDKRIGYLNRSLGYK